MVYATTLIESQRLMHWRIIIKEFGHYIQHITGVDIILDDALSILPYTSVDKYYPITKKAHGRVNKLFTISRAGKDEYCSATNLLNVQRKQQKYMRKVHSKLRTYVSDCRSSYPKQDIDYVKII